MEKKFDVVCLGFADQDIIMEGIDEKAFERDTTHASSVLISSGGDAVNQAIILSRLGNKTAIAAHIGKDTIGRQIYVSLEKEGVCTDYCVSKGIQRSHVSIAAVRPDGNRSFLFGKGDGNLEISLDTIDISILDNTKALCIGSLYNLEHIDKGDGAKLFELAKRKGLTTFADMTADANNIGPNAHESIYPYTDFLFPGLDEALYSTGKKDMYEAANYFLDKGVKNIIITLGEKGCFVKNAHEEFFGKSYKVNSVDTTGCGDNFFAGFVSWYLKGKTLRECADFAAATGAINAKSPGAHETVKNEAQVLEFMRQHAKE